jgi:hypothetical protein
LDYKKLGAFARSSSLRVKMMATLTEVEGRVNTHEAVCELRYESINARLKRIEAVGLTAAGAIIMLLLHLVTKAG